MCHWMRHAGANLVDVSRALGHSSVAVTSIYLHSSDAAVSELIDLSTSMDGDMIDESITYVKTYTYIYIYMYVSCVHMCTCTTRIGIKDREKYLSNKRCEQYFCTYFRGNRDLTRVIRSIVRGEVVCTKIS